MGMGSGEGEWGVCGYVGEEWGVRTMSDRVAKSDSRLVSPSTPLCGTLRMPGDKSISHRLAMLAGLADGVSRLDGFLCSEDCLNTLGAVEALGAGVSREGTCVTIEGTGGRYREPAGILDMGNSGTGMRLLAGLLAGQSFESEITGDASLCSRPMDRIRDPLAEMGADIELSGERGTAPMKIRGGSLRGMTYRLPVASAQVKSCVLLAGLFANGSTTVIEPRPTRDHTERLLLALGIPLEIGGDTIVLPDPCAVAPSFAGADWSVPGDFSSAAFWLAAAACRPGAEVTIEGVGLNPRRKAFLDVLRRMGAGVEEEICADAEWESTGRVSVVGGPLRGIVVEGGEIPNLIDELPLVAVLGAFADGSTQIRDAAELRVKETDRIAAMVTALTRCGVAAEERPDGMIVSGGEVPGGGLVDSHGDHRIAMAMAVLAASAAAPVDIHGVDCIATSYPEFWDHLAMLGGSA